MIDRKYSTAKMAKNIIKKHGAAKFARLIELFRQGKSGTDVAEEFGVTRQRVSQWKSKLGEQHVSFIPHPEVSAILEDNSSSRISV